MSDSLESAYRHHHASNEREGFAILEAERGAFLRGLIGTGKRVLDIGCRDGTLTRHFVMGNEVTGADVDSHALAKAADTLGIRTVRMDLNADKWPLEPDAYDVVVAAEVIEHLFHPERVLERIKRVLRPGGILVGTVPNAFSLKCRLKYLVGSKKGTPLGDPMHINQFGWHEYRRLLQGPLKDVALYPLGRWKMAARAAPSFFAFGIGFSANR